VSRAGAPGADSAAGAPRPLRGRRILVTRPRAQAGRLVALLEAYGAEVVALPTIRLEPPEDWGPLDAALRELAGFRWVLFTSVNGVAAFGERLARAGLGAGSLAGAGVAAIGPETGAAVRRMGIEPAVVPSEYRAEGLADALAARVAPGDHVLLVRAAEARDLLPRELAARGALVTVVPAYRTVLAREGAERLAGLLARRALDVLTFTSSSTVRGFVALLGGRDVRRLVADAALAAIGPITAATAAEHGLRVEIVPRDYTVPALAQAIAAHFEGAPSAAGRD
jgi:uroporphyrinogen III methyltransferase/synthase